MAKSALDTLATHATGERNKQAGRNIDAEFKDLHRELNYLKKQLDHQTMVNKHLWQGETPEDHERANEYVAAIRAQGYKPGMHRYTYYDRRLEKKDRKAPRHNACLKTGPEDLTAVAEEWAARTKTRWQGDGPFPFVFEPVKEKEAAV